MKKIVFLFVFVLSLGSVKAQVDVGFGFAGIWNYTAMTYGADLRAHLIVSHRWTIAPQLQYYPSFNRFHDFYAGTSLHYNFTPSYQWGIYALAHGSYHNWINYATSTDADARQHNWNAEPGIGIIRNYGCVRPFAEARYNIKWSEGNLRIGLTFFFGDCGGNHAVCPAYTNNNSIRNEKFSIN
ncbi:MAG: hypothetical protein ACKOXB_02355 [Flavobacteriales bacterium]